MSAIEKLSISGIRSYGQNDKQVIEFFKPLTLIVGANGSGKTTVIESLRMMTTGQLPPNASRGASFINDPKVSRISEVKAQIRLRFRGVNGKCYTSTRSFQLTNKKGDKQEFKAIEGNIVDDSTKVSTSHRCADMDSLVPQLMGVSPAILENVIFCHQEDSNWSPNVLFTSRFGKKCNGLNFRVLGEPKVLKDKFDAIFASTRYSKALDSIRKLQNEQKLKIKELEGDEKELSAHKEQARKLRLDMEGAEEKKKQLLNGSAASRKQVDEIANKIKLCRGALSEIDQKASQRTALEVERKMLEEQKLVLSQKIEEEYQEDLDELQVFSNKLMEKIKGVERDKLEIERQLSTKKLEEQQEEKKLQAMRNEEAMLKVEGIEHKNKLQNRLEHAKSLSRKYSIQYELAEEVFDKPFASSLFADKIKQLKKTKEGELRKIRDQNREKQEELSKQLAVKSSAKETAERDIQVKEKEIKPLRMTVESLKKEIQQIKSTAEDLARARRKLDECQGKLDRHPQCSDDESKVGILETEVASMDSERFRKREALKKLNLQFERVVVLQQRTKDLAEMQKRVDASVQSERRSIQSALGEMPRVEEVARRLDLHIDRCSKKEQECSKTLREYQGNLVALGAQKERLQNDIQEVQKKIEVENDVYKRFERKNIQAWTRAKDSGQSLETAIADVERELRDELKFAAGLENLDSILGQYIKSAQQKSCCPLCERAFTDARKEIPEFQARLQKKLETVPDNLASAKESEKGLKVDLEELNQARTCRDQIDTLKQKHRALEAELTALNRDADALDNKVEAAKEQYRLAGETLAEAKRLERCVAGWGLADLEKLRLQVEDERADGLSSDGGEDREQLERELERLETKMDAKRKEIQVLRERISANKSESERLMAEFYSARDDVNRQDAQLKMRKDKEGYLQDQEQRCERLERDVKAMRDSISPLEDEVRELQDRKDEMQRIQQVQENRAQQELNDLSSDAARLDSFENEIRNYIELRKEEALKAKQREREACEGQLDALRAERSKLQDKSLVLVERETKHSQTLRGINDNIELRLLENKLASHTRRIDELFDEVSHLPQPRELLQQLRQMEAEHAQLQSSVDRDAGGLERLDEQIRHAMEDLAKKQYVGIDERHKLKHIELHAMRGANKDLDRYYIALDKALMRFHEMKMEEINKTVKEYWQGTYQGRDIDTIEIKADVESAANRRSHNYRLVMRHKSQAELDMRGRCSAGQKVLASLVVRLALAETFCHSCGILALDEPTSNLDHDNIAGFTEALANIVQERSRSAGFQLVVISHDDDFIQDLARLTNVPTFYRIQKDPGSQTSRITAHDVNVL